jgi:hypothetical protein
MERRVKKLVAVLLAIVTGCAGESLSLDLTNTEVTLSVFSGRPDPRWQLSREEAEALATKLRNLPSSDAGPPETHLGYRGFLVRSAGRNIHIGSGLIVVETGETHTVYRDKNRAEDLLRAQAVKRGYGNLIRTAQ